MHAHGAKKRGKKTNRTLSKAIGRDNFSMGAETEEVDVVACEVGIEATDVVELSDVNDDVGRSEYNTS